MRESDAVALCISKKTYSLKFSTLLDLAINANIFNNYLKFFNLKPLSLKGFI